MKFQEIYDDMLQGKLYRCKNNIYRFLKEKYCENYSKYTKTEDRIRMQVAKREYGCWSWEKMPVRLSFLFSNDWEESPIQQITSASKTEKEKMRAQLEAEYMQYLKNQKEFVPFELWYTDPIKEQYGLE